MIECGEMDAKIHKTLASLPLAIDWRPWLGDLGGFFFKVVNGKT